MLDTVKINHVQHISFTQSRLTDAVSVILSELLSYEHPSNRRAVFILSLFYLFSKISASGESLPRMMVFSSPRSDAFSASSASVNS